MKKIVLTMIIACIALELILGFATAPKANQYPLSTVVVELNEENDIVTVEDFNGNLWEFEGVEDWEVGDICAMIMRDNATKIIFDDEIISTRYNGYLK